MIQTFKNRLQNSIDLKTSLLNNDVIIRKDKKDEKGNYQINHNELIIKWDKWDQDIFYTYDNISFYTYDVYNVKYEIIQLIYKDNIQKIILDKKNNNFKNLDKNIEEKYEGVHEFKPNVRGYCGTSKFDGTHPEAIFKNLENLKLKFNKQLKEYV